MSARPCNLCSLTRLLDQAIEAKEVLTITPRPEHVWTKGVDIHIDGKFKAWFAEVPMRCSC